MPRPSSPALRRRVGVFKFAAVTALTALAVGQSLSTSHTATAEQHASPSASGGPTQAELDVAIARHDCSATGYGPDVIPGSALVERDNRIQRVSFDDGWAVYTGDAAGTLLAVCRTNL